MNGLSAFHQPGELTPPLPDGLLGVLRPPVEAPLADSQVPEKLVIAHSTDLDLDVDPRHLDRTIDAHLQVCHGSAGFSAAARPVKTPLFQCESVTVDRNSRFYPRSRFGNEV